MSGTNTLKFLLQPVSKQSFTNFPDDKNHPGCLLKTLFCGQSDSEDSGVFILKLEGSYQESMDGAVLKDRRGRSVQNQMEQPGPPCWNGHGFWAMPGSRWLNYSASCLCCAEAQPKSGAENHQLGPCMQRDF